MLHRVEVLPLRLDLAVVFQFLVALGEADALGVGHIGNLDHHQQVHPQAAVRFLDAGQVEIEDIALFQGAHDVPPAQRQKAAVCLLKSFGKVGHGEHEADHLALFVDHGLEQVLIHIRKILLDEIMNLFFGQGHGTVDLFKRLIEQVKKLLGTAKDLFLLANFSTRRPPRSLMRSARRSSFSGKADMAGTWQRNST